VPEYNSSSGTYFTEKYRAILILFVYIDLINNNNYNFEHLDIREQFIWLMSNEDNFIINQLSDMILKLHYANIQFCNQ
jgi:hypothetical protein